MDNTESTRINICDQANHQPIINAQKVGRDSNIDCQAKEDFHDDGHNLADDPDVEASSGHGGHPGEDAPPARRSLGRSAETKKLVFLSQKVLEMVIESQVTTGSDIAQKILEIYKQQKKVMDFKNVQRRVYDALNVLTALKFIRKDHGRIIW